MTTTTRRIKNRPLDELVGAGNPVNPKEHDVALIDDSIERFGYIEPIVVDERTDRILSGHGRVKTLVARHDRGDSPPDGVQVHGRTGKWLVPVIGWRSKDDTEASAALIALNRATQVGGWNDDALLDLLEDLAKVERGLDGVGFGDDDISALQEQLGRVDQDEDTDRGQLLDIADLSMGEPVHETHRGDVWHLGHHRLHVVNPHTEWASYIDDLEGDAILAPYPDVSLPLTDTGQDRRLVLVQPNLYLAGHLIDKFVAAFPAADVVKVSP